VQAAPVPGRGGALTRVDGADGKPVAALIHDAAMLDHPELLDALASAS